MNVEKILAIAGKPGLFELKVQTRSGFLVESLVDGKKITVGLRSNVSLLTEISMYTYSAEKALVEIMRAIALKENEGPTAVSPKEDNAKLLNYFKEILPDYDEDRVYASDIKKVMNWYNILQAKGKVSKEEPKEESKAESKAKPSETDQTTHNAEVLKEQVVAEVKVKKQTKTNTKK